MKQIIALVLSVLGLLSCGGDSQEEVYGQMMNYYEQGKLRSEKGEYPAGIISFFHAEKYAKEYGDPFFLGLVYEGVSGIYARVYNYIEQQNYARMAYDCFALSGRSDYLNEGLYALAEAHYRNEDYGRSASLAMQLVDSAKVENNGELLAKGLRLWGNACLRNSAYPDAKRAFLQLKEVADSLTTEDYRTLSLAYFKLGELDSAQIYRRYAETENSKGLWVMVKEPKSDKFVAGVISLEEETASRDTTLQKAINQNLAQTVANYHAYEQALQEAELDNERREKGVIIVVAILLVASLGVWYNGHIKVYRKEMELKMLEAENIRHILKIAEDEASSKQELVNQLFEQKFKSLDELCSIYYTHQGAKDEKTKIYNNVIDIISNLSKDKKTIQELETYVNTYRDNLMSDFRTDFPALKEEDYLLFLYIVLDFSSRAISILIGESLSVVYNRKSALKRKIQQSGCARKERFLAEFA